MTKCFGFGFEGGCTGLNVSLILSPVTWSEIEATIVILLTDYVVKMTSICLCLYPHTQAALNFVQRSFFSLPEDINQHRDLYFVRMLKIEGCGYSSLNGSITKHEVERI